MSWDNPWATTQQNVQTFNTNQQTVNAMVPQANADTAAKLAQHATATPWVDPKVQFAMADSGMTPQDPAAQAISQKSINKKGGGFWHDIGEVVKAPAELLNLGLKGLQDVGPVTKPLIRGGLSALETPLQVGMGGLRDIASATGDIGAGVASGAATGLAVGSITGPGALISGAIGGVAGGVLGAIGQARGVKVSGGYVNPLAQSTGGQIAGHWLSGKPVDLGSGYMPGGAVHQDVIKAQEAAANISGHALTPGRFLADTVLHPGSTPYNILSGLTDLVDTFELDPSVHVLGAWGEAGKAADTIEGGTRLQEFGKALVPTGEDLLGKYAPGAGEAAAEAATRGGTQLTNPAVFSNEDEYNKALMQHGQEQGIVPEPGKPKLVGKSGEWSTNDGHWTVSKTAEGWDLFKGSTADDAAKMESYPTRAAALDAAKGLDATHYPTQGVAGLTDEAKSAIQDSFHQSLQDAGHDGLQVGGQKLPISPQEATAARVGALTTNAPAVASETAQNFVNTDPTAAKFAEKVSGMKSPSDIMTAMKNKVSWSTANELAQAETPQDVLDIVKKNIVSGEISQKSTLDMGNSITQSLRTWRSSSRLLGNMPGGVADMLDAFGHDGEQTPKFDKAMQQVIDWTKQARIPEASDEVKSARTEYAGIQQQFSDIMGKIRSGERVDEAGNSLAKQYNQLADRYEELKPLAQAPLGKSEYIDKLSQSTTPDEFKDTVQSMIEDHVGPRLKQAGFSDGDIKDLLGAYWKTHGQMVADLQNEISDGTALTGTMVGDQPQRIAKANEMLEFLNNSVPLPDAREVRQMTTPSKSLRTIYNSGLWDSANAKMDAAMKIWRPLNIVRPAWASRIFTMENIKGLMAGLDLPIKNPIKMIGTMLTGHMGDVLDATDPEGELIKQAAEQRQNLIGLKNMTPGDRAGQFVNGHTLVSPSDDEFGAGWAAHILNAHLNPIAQRIAEKGVDSAFQDFWTGDLAATRERMAAKLNLPELLDYQGAHDHVYGTVLDNVNHITMNNPGVMQAISTGKVGEGISLAKITGDSIINPEAADHLQGIANDPLNTVPDSLTLSSKDPHPSSSVVLQELFRRVAGVPLNQLVRIPAFNQFLWDHMTDMAHLLTPEDQAKLLENAGKESAQLSTEQMGNLQKAVAKGYGEASLSDVTQLAKSKASDSMHDLFMNFSHRSAWQDAMRNVVPFANHWQQEITQWAKLGAENPEAIRKLQMFQGEGENSGFFMKNDQGQWVFNYPASGLAGAIGMGLPFPMQAKESGAAAISTSLLPGFGPLMSIASAKLLPNKPQFAEVKKLLAPYGDPTQQGVAEGMLPQYMRSIQRSMSDPKSDVTFSNTVMETARYLATTGKYDVSTPDGQNKLISDATSKARDLYRLRALGQFTLPSSPTPQMMANDKNGNLLPQAMLSKDYANMEAQNVNTATQQFLDKYGMNASLFLQSNTKTVSPLPTDTDKVAQWAQSHNNLVKELPNTYGFFAPTQIVTNPDGSTSTTPAGKFDYTAYLKSINYGERVNLTPDEMVKLANDKVASMIYYNVKDGLGPKLNQAQQGMLSQLHDALAGTPGAQNPFVGVVPAYPGFGTASEGLPTKLNTAQLIGEIQNGLKDPTIANTDVGKATNDYLQIRQMVLTKLTTPGAATASLKTEKAAAFAVFLRNIAAQLSQQTPGFSLMFDRIFARELPDPSSTATEVASGLNSPAAAPAA